MSACVGLVGTLTPRALISSLMLAVCVGATERSSACHGNCKSGMGCRHRLLGAQRSVQVCVHLMEPPCHSTSRDTVLGRLVPRGGARHGTPRSECEVRFVVFVVCSSRTVPHRNRRVPRGRRPTRYCTPGLCTLLLRSTRELSESVRFASLTQILRGGMYKILEHTPRRGSTTRQPPEARDTSANLRLAQYGFTLNEGRGLVNALLLAWVLVPYKVWRSARTSHVAVCSQSGASRRRRAILTAVQKCDAPAYRLCWRAACSHAAAAGTRDAGVRRAGGRAVVRPDLREHQVHAQV